MPEISFNTNDNNDSVDASLWIKAPQHILRVEGAIARRLQIRPPFWAWWIVVNSGGTVDAAQDLLYLRGLRARLVFFSTTSIACFCLSLFYLSASFVDHPGYILFGLISVIIFAAAVYMALFLSWRVYAQLRGFRAEIAAGIERENLLSVIAGNDERLMLIYEHMPPWLAYLASKPKTIEAAVNLMLNNLSWYLGRPGRLLTAGYILTSRIVLYAGALILMAGSIMVGANVRSMFITFIFICGGFVFASFGDLHVFRKRVICEEMLRYIAGIKLASAQD